MLKRHKDLLRPLITSLRTALAGTTGAEGTWQRGDLDRELERLGIAPDGVTTPIDALPYAVPNELRARAAADAYLAAAVNGAKGAEAETKRRAAREEFVERAAYTWINRLLALRTMEARGLIDETLRANPDYEGIPEALFVLRQTEPARCASADGGWWASLEDACAAQAAALAGLFDLSDPAAALRPSTAALLHCVVLVGTAPAGFSIDESAAAFADPDAIGWCYQFYQEAAKARVYVKLGSGGKATTRAEIAAATQLFTEPYMVQWLLQNSLGRSYHEAYPDSALPATWEYYIRQRPEGQAIPESPRPLEALDLIDPCCGSGHFLREAFDMFAAMYRERHPELSAVEIADRILTHHVHGIDLDPRAAQLAALTLYLRAWELVRDERQTQRLPGPGRYQPAAMNIATTPSGLSAGALQRHLRRHPQDRLLAPLLEGVFAALEQADILGSLLRPAEHIETAMKALQQPHTIPMDFDADDAALRRTITTMARHDPVELKRMLLDRVAHSFHTEAGAAADVTAQLFGREAERGVRLLQLLDRKYAVVVTNPPYMDSGNMFMPVKKYLEEYYTIGKRDLYVAFILRCLELCIISGRAAMVTINKWMLNEAHIDFRAGNKQFQGLLTSTKIEILCDLGSRAFALDNHLHDGVQVALYNFQKTKPTVHDQIQAYRIVGPRDPENKSKLMIERPSNIAYRVNQVALFNLPKATLIYYINDSLLNILRSGNKLGKISLVKKGVSTLNNDKFHRYFWEIVTPNLHRWRKLSKSGKYARWDSVNSFLIDWDYDGQRVKASVSEGYGGSHWSRAIPSPELYFQQGLCYPIVAGRCLGVRRMEGAIFEAKTGALFADQAESLLPLLNTNIVSFLLRLYSNGIEFNTGTLEILSLPSRWNELVDGHTLKAQLVSRSILADKYQAIAELQDELLIASNLHTIEGFNNLLALQLYDLQLLTETVFDDTGTPAGFHPLIAAYDTLPELPSDLNLPPLPQEVLDYLAAHQRIVLPPAELQRIKQRLRDLYEAGPGAKESEEAAEAAEESEHEGEEAAVSGAHIPIPTETFLEELSVKLEIHPISVYWLLEELRAEGARCKPEELRLLRDRLSVLILRLLGYRWPKQIEANEPMPSWADPDGIIPITTGAGEMTLTERVRARLRAEDGDLDAQRTEALLVELTGLNLDEWIRREFFKRHAQQFKYRPIAWHLASSPAAAGKGRKNSRQQPAFECVVYYHACGGDVLARIRTQYVEPLIRAERQHIDAARRANDETAAALATNRIHELEAFAAKLRQVADEGFACPELDKLLAQEPLDRWSGDGYLSPPEHSDLLRQERAWRVDLNDGVRVNIAPLQLVAILASDVLKSVDAKKAIADRARWRSDERKWVRTGKLPRCGWMPDIVPESQKWIELAPQREAERMKLEEKRKKIGESDR